MADTTTTVGKSITVDVTKTNNFTIRMAQSDDATRTLTVKVMDGDKVIPMNSTDYIFLEMKTPDNNYFLKECTNNGDNTCTVTFDANMLASQGVSNAQIVIATGDKDENGDFERINTVLATATFRIYVWESALSGVQQSSDFINIMTFVKGAKYEENVRESNEKTRVSNEEKRVTAEDLRAQQEKLRQSNEEIRKTNETTRQSNEDERKDSENKRKAAEIVRQTNEETREENETNRGTEEEKRKIQEQSRDTAEKERIKNEAARNDAEVKRETDEADRKEAEEGRVSEYATLKHDMENQGKIIESQEEARQTAEKQRDTSEKTRETAEDARIAAEAERDSNEHDRMNAEKGRATAEVVREKNEETRRENERIRISNERIRIANENQRNENEGNRIVDTQNMIADGQNVIEQVAATKGDYIEKTKRGAVDGVASLNNSGKVPISQLPGSFLKNSYEGTANNVTKSTSSNSTYAESFTKKDESGACVPEDDAVYIDTTLNISFIWTGSRYASVDSFGIGETSATAFAGDRGVALENNVKAIKTRQSSIDGSPVISWLLKPRYDSDGNWVGIGWNPYSKKYDFSGIEGKKTKYTGTANNVVSSTYEKVNIKFADSFTKTGDSSICTPEEDAVYTDTSSGISYIWSGTRFVSINDDTTKISYPSDEYNIEQLQAYGTKDQIKAFGEAMICGSPTKNVLTCQGILPDKDIQVMFYVKKKKFDDDLGTDGGTTITTPTTTLTSVDLSGTGGA